MRGIEGEELEKLRGELEKMADALRARVAEVLGLTERIEELTKDTPV